MRCAPLFVLMAMLAPQRVLASPDPPEAGRRVLSPDPPTSKSAAPIVHASVREGVGVSSHDQRFALRLGMILVTRAGVDERATPFAKVHLTRVLISGHVWGPRVRYFLGVELTREPYLRDLELTLAWRPELQLRVGRARTPFSRQFLTSRAQLQFTDRSFVSDFFRAGRGTGLALDGQPFAGRMEYRVGVYDDASGIVPSQALVAAARVAYNPLGAFALDETTARHEGEARVAIGVNAYTTTSSRDPGDEPNETPTERSAVGVDLALRAGGLNVAAEAYVDRRRIAGAADRIGVGGFAQAGVFLVPTRFELAARVGRLARDLSTDHAWRVELGASYYLHEVGLKLQAGYGYAHASATALLTGHNAQLQAVLAF